MLAKNSPGEAKQNLFNSMTYIIDANNLAGRLKMLRDRDFDKRLIEKIKLFNQGKGRKIILVFDSQEPMGDKITLADNITVIYSPRDKYYKSADDKIVELIERIDGSDSSLPANDEYVVVSEDNELIQRIEKIQERINKKISIERTSRFIQSLEQHKRKIVHESSKRDLDHDAIDNINKELLDIWQ